MIQKSVNKVTFSRNFRKVHQMLFLSYFYVPRAIMQRQEFAENKLRLKNFETGCQMCFQIEQDLFDDGANFKRVFISEKDAGAFFGPSQMTTSSS